MYKTNVLSTSTKVVAAGFTAIALMFAMALPANAQEVDCNVAINVASCNTDNSVEDSPVNNGGTQANNGSEITQYSVNGNCSGVVVTGNQTNVSVSDADSDSDADGGNGGTGALGTGGAGGAASSSSSASNTTTQSNVGSSFSADCSVTNITQAAAASSSAVAQVKAVPGQGVNAGAGAAAASALPSLGGLLGSVVAFGAGALRIRKFNV
jgi:hypothetical protein